MNLGNPRWEEVARALARGSTYVEACAAAGLEGMNATQCAKLCKRPDIIKRVNELKTEFERKLNLDTEALEDMTPEEIKKLVTPDFLVRELVISIKMSQTAAQFNATKALIELLGKEIGMFGGNGAKDSNNNNDAITNNQTNIINVLQNIHKLPDMSAAMHDITPQSKFKTKSLDKISLMDDEEEVS